MGLFVFHCRVGAMTPPIFRDLGSRLQFSEFYLEQGNIEAVRFQYPQGQSASTDFYRIEGL